MERKNFIKIHTSNEVGDHVHCNNCGAVMLVDRGTDVCPECGFDGALAWQSEYNQELRRWEAERINSALREQSK
jgi:uncharacterized Zn finger protein (UPF0148 family)